MINYAMNSCAMAERHGVSDGVVQWWTPSDEHDMLRNGFAVLDSSTQLDLKGEPEPVTVDEAYGPVSVNIKRKLHVQLPVMTASILDLQLPDPSRVRQAKIINEGDGYAAFRHVLRRSYEGYAPTSDAYLGHHAVIPVVLEDYDQAPAACALSFTTGSIAGLYWVGVVPDRRGRGLGREATLLALHLARSLKGAQRAVLQASREGDPMYRAMGFQEITRYRVYHSI